MNRHLTEEEIIKYEFKLLADKQLQRARVHLEECSSCRRLQERLQGKFAVLETLREETKASEELIAKTLALVRQAPPTRGVYLTRLVWLRAAAAVIVITGGLLATMWWMNPASQKQGEIEIAQTPKSDDINKGRVEERSRRRDTVIAEAEKQISEKIGVESKAVDLPAMVAAAEKLTVEDAKEEFIPQ
ncbi:MAG: hypothetical protein AMJ79_11275, partial [Phycisphaerae bacterium SM23_30]